MKKKERIVGLDVVRFFAIFFVVSVHYILYSPFYNAKIEGSGMFILLFLRWLFFTCVPLFLLLTGYLNGKKEGNKKHYKSILPLLCSYFFLSIVTLLFLKFYFHSEDSFLHYIKGIFNFTTIGNAWYVEMYIGLFLLIPFLNILYQNIDTKKKKQILIGTLLFLVSVPNLFNSFEIRGKNLDILPNWWTSLYPLLYYFIGSYIKEYQIKIPKKKNIIAIFFLLLIETILTFIYNHGQTFGPFLDGYFAFPTILLSVLLFLLFYDVDIKNKIFRFIITDFSLLSFDMYLFSFITERIIYNAFHLSKFPISKVIYSYIFLAPFVFLITYLCICLKRKLQRIGQKLWKKVKSI